AFGLRFGNNAGRRVVDWYIYQKSGALRAVAIRPFLNKRNAPGHRADAGIARMRHGGAARLLRIHVEAERPLVSFVFRFEEQDGGDDVALALGPDPEAGPTLRAHPRLHFGALSRRHDLGEAYALKTWIELTDAQAVVIALEF